MSGESPIVLRGGTVIDGSGTARFVADIRIQDQRISHVGPQVDARDAQVIDVAGRIVAPGFIDVHT
ncbi:MAG TPA: D-aminoacylase, partial [Casimicrobiaceae bacterium]|nr:D-aminoacylase [Casimicrobiaceae bacterium]